MYTAPTTSYPVMHCLFFLDLKLAFAVYVWDKTNPQTQSPVFVNIYGIVNLSYSVLKLTMVVAF